MSSEKIIHSRSKLPKSELVNKQADEGGCGVVGCASSVPIAGKHFLTSLDQMKNRGNGKGGGVAMLGLDPTQWGISQEILDSHYIYQIAYLDDSVIDSLEGEFILPSFNLSHRQELGEIDDFRSIGLDVKPPKIVQYYVTLKDDVSSSFIEDSGIADIEKATDEFVYQNTYRLNTKYYASLGDKQAFVLSHAKNLLVIKIVGYADHVLRYYKLEEKTANIWIGHHRYPTKGTVWHPGGAHPFIGMNEALVHNGDFSNYHAVSEYLAQRNIYPQFLTDTEVAALQFDLYARVFEYPTEYVIEALAPTTERDFTMLTPEKQNVYRQIQHTHLHGSPDGPWFFIIGRSMSRQKRLQLLGITDTSMLRPQVFALYETEDVSIGLIGSERQAIDATLRSLAQDDKRFASKADIYWNARGGSYTDGGAFMFDVDLNSTPSMACQDKFGNTIKSPTEVPIISSYLRELIPEFEDLILEDKDLIEHLSDVYKLSSDISDLDRVVQYLTAVLDRWHLIPGHKNGRYRATVEETLYLLFRKYPSIGSDFQGVRIENSSRGQLVAPLDNQYLVMDVSEFDVEGPNSAANFIVDAYHLGWKRIYAFDWRGHRFAGVGLGKGSDELRLDLYGNPGDYLASGLDGAEIYVHASAQDQVGQMMKSGKLVIYGDVGQTFLYGAKGGEIYVLGNAAGRPLINAVGRPKLVINGSCLDYLAESFMAGDPLSGGGFSILQGNEFTNSGKKVHMDVPYSGGNLFSLASGGAIYIQDPNQKIESNQLHGGVIGTLSEGDQKVISSYLRTNADLFSLEQDFDSGWDKYIKISPKNIKN